MPRAKPKTEAALKQPPANGIEAEILTLPEAAAYLRVGEQDVLRMVHDQGLPGRQVGTEWRFLAQQRFDQTEAYLGGVRVVSVEATASAKFDKLRANKKLKKIGRADLLIAAITLAHSATVVTRNLQHFRQVPGLQVENWVD